MGCVLFSRPDHDVNLGYLFYYSKELVKLAEDLNHDSIDKQRKNASKKIILSVIEKKKPSLIIFNGHGSPSSICGHRNEEIISVEENPEDLKGSIVYSLSCSSALLLGPIAVDEGALSFIGYRFDFALGKDPNSEAAPRKDKIAKLFLEPSNILVKFLLNGNTVYKSVETARKKMKENVDYLSVTNDFPEASHYAPFLYGNYLGLIAHGDKETSFS